MSDAVASAGIDQDHAAMTIHARTEITNSLARCKFRRRPVRNPVRGPFAEYELHDGLTPAGQGDGAALIIGVAAAAYERGIADASGGLV